MFTCFLFHYSYCAEIHEGIRGDIELYILQQKSYGEPIDIANQFGKKLNNIDLRGIYLKDAILSNIDFSKSRFDLANLTDTYLIGANLSNTSMKGIDASRSLLNNAKFFNSFSFRTI